jgi:hypothetical protein
MVFLYITGAAMYGRVNVTPQCYVTTKFWHLFWMPLVPYRSWAFVRYTEGKIAKANTIPIPLLFRSILLGYVRGTCCLAAIFGSVAFVGWNGVGHPRWWVGLVIAWGAIAIFAATYLFRRAGARTVRRLAGIPGLENAVAGEPTVPLSGV